MENTPLKLLCFVFPIAGFQCHAIQNRSKKKKKEKKKIDKVQNLGNERRYIYIGIFRIRDIRRNVLPKLIEICMETPCWCSPI